MSLIKGIYAASMSVLNDDLTLNITKTIEHAEMVIENGCHGAAIFGSTGQAQLIPIAEKINLLRISLIKEELEELQQAIHENNILEVADALTDILYVTYGAGHAFGINLDKCFNEVQESNMSKLGENGKPIYNENGKVMKGPNYFKPELSKFIK